MARKKSKSGKKMAVEKTLGQFAKDKLGAKASPKPSPKTGPKTKAAMPMLGPIKKKPAKLSSESETSMKPKSGGARKKLKDVTF